MHFRLVLAVWSLACFARAAAPPEWVDTARVNSLIEKLDHDSFDVRQEADESLRAVGKAVVPLLKDEMAVTRSLEVRARLRRMVHDLTIDERVGELIRQLTDANATTRERAGWALRKAGSCVVPWLRKELKPDMPAEQRQRVETLIAELAPGR